MQEKRFYTRNTSRQIAFILCCLVALIHASEGNLNCNCERCSQEKMKTDSPETNIKTYPSHDIFAKSHEMFLFDDETVSPKSNGEYLKDLQEENSKLHKRSVRSAPHKKFKRSLRHAKTSYPILNLAGRGRRENPDKGRLKRNAMDSKSKADSLSDGPMHVSLLIDGLPPSHKDTRKRETNGVKCKKARSGGNKRHPKENTDQGIPGTDSGEGKGLLSAKETAAAGSLDLAKYVEEPKVNIRRKRVNDLLDKLFPARRKRKAQPENFDSSPYNTVMRKGYSYNRVEDDPKHNARFLFV